MPDYKTVNVDEETYEKFLALCEAYERKQVAQFRVMVNAEYEKLEKVKLLPKDQKTAKGG